MVVRRRPQRGHRFTESPVLQLALQGWRSRTVGLLLMVAFLSLVVRGFYLQVINNDFLQQKGDSRYLRDIEISASRGKIVDRNGDMLAVSTPMKTIWAIPADARTMNGEQKRQLAGMLDMNVRELDGKIASEKTFTFVKRQVSPETADRIGAQKFPGVHQEKEYRRFYPTGDMTAHIVGFTGVDDKGLEGVELAFQNSLLGRPGSRTVIRDRRGNIVEDVGATKPPQDGKDVRLALDSKIQYLAFSQLKAAVEANNAKAGGAIVIDARTGEILALGRRRVLFVAGEASGDLHGGFLVRELQRQIPGVEIAGVGGDQLRAWSSDHRQCDHFRCPPARCADCGPGHPEIVECRDHQDRARLFAQGNVGHV